MANFTFMNLPQPQYPRSALLDFAPLQNAIADYGEGAQEVARHTSLVDLGRTAASGGYAAASKRAFEMGEIDAGADFERAAQSQQDRLFKRYGLLGKRINEESDPAKRTAMWSQALERFKRDAVATGLSGDFDPDELDPITGPQLLMSYAGIEPADPLDRDTKRAQLAKLNAETAGLDRKARLDDAFTGMILGDGSAPPTATLPQRSMPSPQPPGFTSPNMPQGGEPADKPNALPQLAPSGQNPMPGIMLQSYPGGGPRMRPTPAVDTGTGTLLDIGRDAIGGPQPGVELAQYAPQPPQGYDGPYIDSGPSGAPVASADDTIETPMGQMTRRRARQIAGMMLMDPGRAAMGKEMLDATRSVGPGMNKPAVNAIQGKQFDAIEQLSRLKSIEQSWKPEYQTIETRLGFAWDSWKDKFSTKALSGQQRQELAAYSANRAEGLNNLNQYIKEITGAAMTNAEAIRIRNSQADPGEGIFDGDSPTVFDAKMKANIRITKLALARYAYLTKRGFPPDAETLSRELSLDDMPKVIQQRTNQLLQESLSQNPGAAPQDVAPIVRQRLRSEFGIDA